MPLQAHISSRVTAVEVGASNEPVIQPTMRRFGVSPVPPGHLLDSIVRNRCKEERLYSEADSCVEVLEHAILYT
jgi:hypothetical protein